MSVIMPDNLRYIKRIQLEEEQKIMSNYYQDIIRSYGIDIIYLKRNNTFSTSGINSDIIYGHKENASYDLSASMISYMEVDSSILAINALGLIPQDELTFYFSINDFAVTFANDVSQYAEYSVTPISGYLPYSTSAITLKFNSPILSGTVSYNTSGEISGTNINIVPDQSCISNPLYSIAINPYLHTSFNSLIQGGYAGINLFLSFNRGNYKGINRTFYQLSGTVLYSDLELALKHTSKIRPNVGDIIVIDFPGNEQLEQYEITEVYSRKPTSNDGINPLLGKYIWKCKANRRISSYETGVNSDIMSENATEDFMDTVKKTLHDKNSTFKDIHDYSITDVDDVYGGYDSAVQLEQDPDRYIMTDVISGTSIIQDFNNGTSLLSDGNDLYFQNSSVYTNITNNTSGNIYNEYTFPAIIDKIMYLKIRDGNIYFTSNITSGSTYINNKITNFTENIKKEQYSFDYIIKDVNNKYNLNNSSYIFKSDRFAIFSNGTSLIAINENGEEYVII